MSVETAAWVVATAKANRGRLLVLAEALAAPPSTLEIVRGHGARAKAIEVKNLTAEAVRSRVLASLAVDTGPRRP